MPHITFIHGISNKPPADELLKSWVDALASNGGVDLDQLGITYSMVYWADVMYSEPEDEDAKMQLMSLGKLPNNDPQSILSLNDWRHDVHGQDKEFLDTLQEQLLSHRTSAIEAKTEALLDNTNLALRFPIPDFAIHRLMERFLRDVYFYLFNKESTPRPGETYQVQNEIRRRFVQAVKDGAMKSPTGPHLVIGHSMGTVIAYDCLKRVASCPAIDGIMTLGSPLGLKEVQEHLTPEWTRENGYPTEKVHGNWWNIYDRLDVVCGFDPKLGNDFLESGHPKVRDIYQKNDGWWRHHIAKYFVEEPLRNALKNLLGLQEK